MGLSFKRIGKGVLDFGSRAFDQVNMLDNNRTFKQRTATDSERGISQFRKRITEPLANATVVPAKNVAVNTFVKTPKSYLDAFGESFGTGSKGSFADKLARSYDLQQASARRQGMSGDPVRDIIAPGVETGINILSAGTAGIAGKEIANQGLKVGVKSQLPQVRRLAGQNFAQGAGQELYQDNPDLARAVKRGAINTVVGTAADVGFGAAGYGTAKLGAKLKTPVKPVVRLKTEAPAPTPKLGADTPVINKPITRNLDELDAELETSIYGRRPDSSLQPTKLGKAAEALSINRQARKLTQPVEKAVNKVVRASEESGSRILRTPGRAAVGVSRQAGRTARELAEAARYEGAKKLGDVYGKSIKELGDQAVERGVRREAVAAALDPELHAARGKAPLDLTPEEAIEVERLRKIIDTTHEGNYALGRIDDKTYAGNKGKYFPRDFTEFFNDDAARQIARDNKLELNIFKHRKDLSDIPKEVLDAAQTDPYYMAALRVQQYERNKAFTQYSNWLSQNGSISPGPRKGYIRVPESQAYGSLQGKYVLKEQLEDLQGFIYETNSAQNAVALLNAYDRNPLRRARKMQLTVFNPGVRLGNRTFNYLITSLNGINPITFARNYMRGRKMIRSNSPEYLEAVQEGIFGSSIIDKELYRGGEILAKKHRGPIRYAQETYQAVDDEAKMSAYITFRERGLAPAEAAQRTGRMLQNYDMVGNLFDLGAKTPVGGNAFVRFSSELMRIAHNTAVDNPVRAAGAAVAASALVAAASRISGETDEDRATREGRVGAPRIPFTNQSLEVQTPWGAINAGRLIGLTTYNDLNGGFGQEAERLLPFQSPVRPKEGGGLELNPKALASDPLIGPLVSLGLDEDFRGKKITDPDAAKYPNQPLSDEQKGKNRLNYLKMAYVPWANEADSLVSAAQGRENYYGKERSVPQAALRVAGIKVEQFGPEQAKKQRETNAYFDGEFKRADQFLKDNPTLEAAYNKFKGREKVRSGDNAGKKLDDLVTPERWQLVASDASGKLYNFLKQEAVTASKEKGQPLDPIYRLPTKEQTKQVLELRSRPTGDDIETEEILRATQPWYAEFEQAERDYYDANDAYFKTKNLPDTQGVRAKAYGDIGMAEQPPLVKQYYQLKETNPEAAKNMFKTTNLSDAFDAYTAERLRVINAKRKIEGFPPIDESTFNNVTFGYEDDERKVFNELKYGRGFGGGFGGGRGRKSAGSAYKYAVSLNAGGNVERPKVSIKSGSKPKVAAKKLATPKVSLKKSKV